MEYSHAWTVAFRQFDPHPCLDALSDTQSDFIIVCVGAKRSAFWDGTDWQYAERNAERYGKREASAIMASLPLFRYCRLVRQPKPEMQGEFPELWPTVNGWHMEACAPCA